MKSSKCEVMSNVHLNNRNKGEDDIYGISWAV